MVFQPFANRGHGAFIGIGRGVRAMKDSHHAKQIDLSLANSYPHIAVPDMFQDPHVDYQEFKKMIELIIWGSLLARLYKRPTLLRSFSILYSKEIFLQTLRNVCV